MIIVVDASNILYASYYAMSRQLDTAQPFESALYGFLNTIRERANTHPNYMKMYVCFDSGRCWRHRVYENYKDHGPTDEKKEAERTGIKMAADTLLANREWMPWYTVVCEDQEADDLAAFIVRRHLAEHGVEAPVQLVSGDKDWLQMVGWGHNVQQYRAQLKATVTLQNFAEQIHVKKTTTKKGVKSTEVLPFDDPRQWAIFRILSGDNSDNIKGVPGFGDVSAYAVSKTLRDEYGCNLQPLLDNPAEVIAKSRASQPKKLLKTFTEGQAQPIIFRNADLMLFKRIEEFGLDLDACVTRGVWDARTFDQWLMDLKFLSVQGEMHVFNSMGLRHAPQQE